MYQGKISHMLIGTIRIRLILSIFRGWKLGMVTSMKRKSRLHVDYWNSEPFRRGECMR